MAPNQTESGMNSTSSATLREEMRERYWDLHDIGNKLLAQNVLNNKMTWQSLKVYTAQLYHIYKAIEDGLEKLKEHPQIEPIYFPEVLRIPPLEKDLTFLYGENWREEIPILDTVKDFVEHIARDTERDPVKLVAHSYVRYMGDVSGGQIVGKVISRNFKLPVGSPGADFYDFSNIANLNNFKALYTSRLEAIDLDPEEREMVVSESRVSFQKNIDFIREMNEIIDEEMAHQEESPVESPVESPKESPIESPVESPESPALSLAPNMESPFLSSWPRYLTLFTVGVGAVALASVAVVSTLSSGALS